MSDNYFQSVGALPDYQLEVVTGTGALVRFDFKSHLHTVRFWSLSDMSLFRSVNTDGDCLYFDQEGYSVVKITASEFIDLLMVDRSG